ncbi:copper resistance protein B [Sphingomonas naphthae]|uniref:Copper resistance protein B n=1 Tax=Sphingomonas naphthae TaxID=1813468 RepID=A0ABY7TRB6_9SPHN|nr:copper resistance protein B [Sphingomonas naphthae]WCT74364.1 copper resistance protein B [Sphingomonas naphthae]
MRRWLPALAGLAASPLAAQTDPHAHHMMPGMAMPAAPAAQPTEAPPPPAHDHAAMDHAAPAEPAARPGSEPAPAPPTDHAAERFYPAAAMAAARRQLAREHGGMTYHMLIADIAEWQVRDGRDGFRWEGEGWYGGDLNRLVVKTEGEGTRGRALEAGEVQALDSRAIDPYWNLQAGIRQDVARGPSPTYAVLAVEGLAPFWFELEGSLFLSDKGDLTGRISGYVDQRITQALVLQPRIELNLAAQDVARQRIGSGLSSADFDLRLRYEIVREFAPYIGVTHERRFGDTAHFARAAGDGARSTSLVVGVRAWF